MAITTFMFGLIGAGSVLTAAFCILMGFQASFFLRKRICKPILPCTCTKEFDSTSSKEFSKDGGHGYLFKEVEQICEGFSNLVGEGLCHYVYKGTLDDGTEVAVKRVKDEVEDKSLLDTRFQLQVELLSRIHHQHLINLMGFCEEKSHRMLIFQYAPNGTLFDYLHNDDEHLSWNQRMRIAVGAACGLTYLHHSCNPCIIHGDFTSHNILLTEDYAAKIAGVGKVPRSETAFKIIKAEDFVESEMVQKRDMSPAVDVYSFGVLLLELLSGKFSFSEDSGMLVEWAGKFLVSRDQMTVLTDPVLKNVPPLELYSVCEIARLCIQREALNRPNMQDVLYMLMQSLGIGPETAAPISSPATLRGLMENF